jgi:hypothetical protein
LKSVLKIIQSPFKLIPQPTPPQPFRLPPLKLNMKFLAGVAALASLAAAAPAPSGAHTPLDVKLESAGKGGQVKATITNNGKSDLKIFRHGTIFDNASTEKATVTSGGMYIALGFHQYLNRCFLAY